MHCIDWNVQCFLFRSEKDDGGVPAMGMDANENPRQSCAQRRSATAKTFLQGISV
jgi:hypothetical protein